MGFGSGSQWPHYMREVRISDRFVDVVPVLEGWGIASVLHESRTNLSSAAQDDAAYDNVASSELYHQESLTGPAISSLR